jgi:hypothetical protein
MEQLSVDLRPSHWYAEGWKRMVRVSLWPPSKGLCLNDGTKAVM